MHRTAGWKDAKVTKTAKAGMPPLQAHRLSDGLAGEIVARSSDIALVLDADGVIKSLSVNPDNIRYGSLDHWVGRKLEDVLTIESRTKLEKRLRDLAEPDPVALRRIELNHQDGKTWEFPIRYTIHDTGFAGEYLFVGTDLQPVAQIQQQLVKAQLALEQDYENFREIESRYRLLLDTVQEPIVVVDSSTCRIAEINDAAARLLGASVQTLTGGMFAQAFVGQRREDFCEMLREAGQSGSLKPVHAETRRGNEQIAIHPRLFRTSTDILLMCRLRADSDVRTGDLEALGWRLTALFYNAPDAFVFADLQGDILEANEAFLVLAAAAEQRDVVGRSLGDFLARGSVDLKVLLENTQRAGRMRNYTTRAINALGASYTVDISVTALRDSREPGFGFVLRDMSPEDSAADAGGAPVDGQALQSVVELVGSAPLKELVSATTDVVEKMCIEAAVQLTNNNRVAAAEMLGLSRQSLYVKLRKYGLIGQNTDQA